MGPNACNEFKFHSARSARDGEGIGALTCVCQSFVAWPLEFCPTCEAKQRSGWDIKALEPVK